VTDESPLPIEPHVVEASRRRKLPSQRAEALRTTFWLAPVILVLVAVGLFAVTFAVDVAAYHHQLTLPFWVRTGSADAGRQVLIAIAAAVITVIGVVFSITILALTLASQQFGPRMMRNFMRDLGNQLTLGVFVGTFVYAVLALGFISGSFVPHLSITVSEALLLVDLGVLIYFIHHIATSIQLPEVIAKIAADLFVAIDDEFPLSEGAPEPEVEDPPGRTAEDLGRLLDDRGVAVPAAATGYLQFVAYGQLVKIATRVDAVIRLSHRPGHFVLAGRPLAEVWPAGAAGQVHQALTKAHLTGPHRTLSQDPVFAIDQLVEIAIRALSPAVNDTFSALTCIDWLSAGLCRVSGRILDEGVFRDDSGRIRLVEPDPSYARMVNRAFDKVRQAAEGMPAVVIRLLDSLTHVVEYTRRPAQRSVLLRQAEMVLRGAERSITEPEDLADVRRRYEQVVTTAQRMGQSPGGDGSHPAGRSTEAGPGASASSRTRSIASTPPTGGPVVGDG
jgi:uncharacterized membrane protein